MISVLVAAGSVAGEFGGNSNGVSEALRVAVPEPVHPRFRPLLAELKTDRHVVGSTL